MFNSIVFTLAALSSSLTSHVKTEEGLFCRYDLLKDMKLVMDPIAGQCPVEVTVTGTWYLLHDKTDGICWYVFQMPAPFVIGKKTDAPCARTLYFGGDGKEV